MGEMSDWMLCLMKGQALGVHVDAISRQLDLNVNLHAFILDTKFPNGTGAGKTFVGIRAPEIVLGAKRAEHFSAFFRGHSVLS
jgi:hypothetical protein